MGLLSWLAGFVFKWPFLGLGSGKVGGLREGNIPSDQGCCYAVMNS